MSEQEQLTYQQELDKDGPPGWVKICVDGMIKSLEDGSGQDAFHSLVQFKIDCDPEAHALDEYHEQAVDEYHEYSLDAYQQILNDYMDMWTTKANIVKLIVVNAALNDIVERLEVIQWTPTQAIFSEDTK